MTRVQIRQKQTQFNKDKITFNFDVSMLNALILYTQCDYISRSDLYNLQKLMNFANLDSYRSQDAIHVRLCTIMEILKAMVDLNLRNTDLLLAHLKTEFEPGVELVNNLGFEKNHLSVSECEQISKFVIEKLQNIEIYQRKDKVLKILSTIDDTVDFNVSYYQTIQELKEEISALLASLQYSDQGQGLLKDFAFSSPNSVNILTNVLSRLKKPSSILQTGIRQLNALLSPGFKAGRLYTILGGSGKFKSGTLLNIADQIRRFNPQIIPVENGLRKCILFITLENSIEETIERLYDMYSDVSADLRNSTIEEIIATLRESGGLLFDGSGSGGIDIYFKYAGNLEISTADIYGFMSDLKNRGYQPICIVLDYIKRIDSAHNSNGDERVRMSFVTKELKSIAEFYQIPVITAMQLNREGNSIIDASMRDNKHDVARFVGSSNIGNAWDIYEDSDWVCLINLELQKSTGRLFLTFKRLKNRGKNIAFALDYFNHPFINAKNIRLDTDVDKAEPISIISLANDLESIKEDPNDNKYTNLQAKSNERKTSTSIINSLKGTSTTTFVA